MVRFRGESADATGDQFVVPRVLELVVVRVLKNAGLAMDVAYESLAEFVLLTVSDELATKPHELKTGRRVPSGTVGDIAPVDSARQGLPIPQ